jgi:hypothetical protein
MYYYPSLNGELNLENEVIVVLVTLILPNDEARRSGAHEAIKEQRCAYPLMAHWGVSILIRGSGHHTYTYWRPSSKLSSDTTNCSGIQQASITNSLKALSS